MRFDLSKFQGLPDKAGTVGTSGDSVENTSSVASPLTNSEWVQVGTLDGGKPDPVPTPDQVGTEWGHREALQTLAVPTVPTVPTPKSNTCTKNTGADLWGQITQSAEWLVQRFPNEDEALRFVETVSPRHTASRHGASVQVDFQPLEAVASRRP